MSRLCVDFSLLSLCHVYSTHRHSYIRLGFSFASTLLFPSHRKSISSIPVAQTRKHQYMRDDRHLKGMRYYFYIITAHIPTTYVLMDMLVARRSEESGWRLYAYWDPLPVNTASLSTTFSSSITYALRTWLFRCRRQSRALKEYFFRHNNIHPAMYTYKYLMYCQYRAPERGRNGVD